VVVTQGADIRTTNALAMAIAPEVTKLPVTVKGGAKIKLACKSLVQPSQQVSLFLGMQECPRRLVQRATNQLTFASSGIAPGKYWMRLRIDGVDSRLIDHSKKTTRVRPSQTVTFT